MVGGGAIAVLCDITSDSRVLLYRNTQFKFHAFFSLRKTCYLPLLTSLLDVTTCCLTFFYFYDKILLIARRRARQVSAEQRRTRQERTKWQKRSTSLDRNQEKFCTKKDGRCFIRTNKVLRSKQSCQETQTERRKKRTQEPAVQSQAP